MSKTDNSKVIAGISVGVLLLTLLMLIKVMRSEGTLEDALNTEKLNSESLVSEKLLLDKEINKFREQVSSLSGQNAKLDNLLTASSVKLAAQEAEFNRAKRDNQSFQQLRKQYAKVVALRKELDREVSSLKSELKQSHEENMNLSSTVAALQERNKMLIEDLEKALRASVDNLEVQTLKGNNILTIKGRRVKKLVTSFDIPSYMKALSYRIIDPKGNVLTEKDGTTRSKVIKQSESYIASSITGERLKNISKYAKVEMTYLPIKKLSGGVYRVEILNDNLYVGGLQVRLR